MEIAAEERRAHERQPFYEQVDLVSNGKLYKSLSMDLSKGGMFLNNRYLSPDDTMTLTYTYGYTPFKKKAKVVRQCDTGVGIQFLDEPKREVELLSAEHIQFIF